MAKSALNLSRDVRSWWRPSGIPVLLYHGIAASESGPIPAAERKFWISSLQFIDQIREIRSEGCRVEPLRELWRPSGFGGKSRLLAITFDDGHVTDYTVAFPLLQEFGLRADFFLNTATVGTPGYLTWDQINEMHRAGMSFQSHSHNHVDLTHVSSATLRRQLSHSKELIEIQLGHPVEFLSAPYGLVNRKVMRAAIELGFRAVCTSRNWPAQLGWNKISRVCIHTDTSRHEFKGLLARDLRPYATRSVREAMVYLPRQILLRFHPSYLTVQTLGGQ